MTRKLYGYWRSTTSYRVRIALALKGLDYEPALIDLRTGEQHNEAFKALNPQGFVPYLVDGEDGLAQSLAIVEYLDECYPEPRLIPEDRLQRARVRGIAQIIACDVHPLNNLRVLKHLEAEYQLDQEARDAWARKWIEQGFATLETIAAGDDRPFMGGDTVTLADVCLVPQLYNARRVETDLAQFPRLLEIEQRLMALPAFQAARPEAQPEAQTQ